MSVKLTQAAVERAVCPPGKVDCVLWDHQLAGFGARVRASGNRTWILRYRAGKGRHAPKRFIALGDVAVLSLAEARRIAREHLGTVATGRDPVAEGKAEAKQARARLGPALDRYEADLARRRVVKRAEVLSLLRRELLRPLGNVPLAEIDRATLADRVNAVAASGRPGAAAELKTRATVLLGWCVGEGLIKSNRAAGWRRPRATRAELLEPHGRALADHELPAFWQAAEASGDPIFAAYLRFLLLTGQRRTETAAMRWQDLDLEAAVWTIPAEITKSGRPHRVPLPREVVAILAELPVTTGPVFAGRGGAVMSGWSKRLAPVYVVTEAAGLPAWSLHDLRRTFRSGLAALGVDHVVAELMLGHTVPGGTLMPLYHRAELWPERVEAASRWARHVIGIVTGSDGEVVPLRSARHA